MTLRRVTRVRRLTAEESAKYDETRKPVAEELPELIARHRKRLVARDPNHIESPKGSGKKIAWRRRPQGSRRESDSQALTGRKGA